MAWQVYPVLPNIDMEFALSARHALIVPAADARVRALAAAHPPLDTFLGRFRSAHGQDVAPSVILIDDAATATRQSGEALVGLRNCLSVATILRQTTQAHIHHGGHRILYSDAFDLYPWQLDRYYEHMVSITPAVWAMHRLDKFAGQPAPGMPVYKLSQFGIDQPLLKLLLAHWDDGYERPRMRPINRAIFRSLNTAQAAMAMPAATGATMFDYGRQCSLWISAFEILANFESGRANLLTVMALLTMKPFLRREVAARRYTVRYKRVAHRVGLAVKLYQRLYQVRNDFLHGNPVTRRSLYLPDSGRFIGQFAPLLYRCALRNVLDLHHPDPPGGDIAQRLVARMARADLERPQFETEEAMLRALVPIADDEDD